MAWETIAVGLGAPAIAGVVSFIIGRSKNSLERYVAQESTAIKMVEAQNAKIAHMEDRLQAVEAELDATESKLRAALAYLDVLAMWLYTGRPGNVPPLPDALKSVLANAKLWDKISWGKAPDNSIERDKE